MVNHLKARFAKTAVNDCGRDKAVCTEEYEDPVYPGLPANMTILYDTESRMDQCWDMVTHENFASFFRIDCNRMGSPVLQNM
jgi:hypothetical protein